VKKLIGSGVTASCGSCPCNVTSHACNGLIRYYDDTNCGSQLGIATSTCGDSGANGGETTRSYRWEGQTTGTCSAVNPSASAALEGVSTVCCE
jgi:hypothetical protein